MSFSDKLNRLFHARAMAEIQNNADMLTAYLLLRDVRDGQIDKSSLKFTGQHKLNRYDGMGRFRFRVEFKDGTSDYITIKYRALLSVRMTDLHDIEIYADAHGDTPIYADTDCQNAIIVNMVRGITWPLYWYEMRRYKRDRRRKSYNDARKKLKDNAEKSAAAAMQQMRANRARRHDK